MSLRVRGWTLRGVFNKCQILWFGVCAPPPPLVSGQRREKLLRVFPAMGLK